ncbi:MAG TPA: hypothetical protein VLM40_16550, partial [Gemmata sp.]|nr:hypothetical protein [Gemmata sp.]
KIDPVRRALQRSYVDILGNEFRPTPVDSGLTLPTSPRRRGGISFGGGGGPSELRAVARVALAKLEKEIDTAKGKATDVATVAHLGDLQAEIKNILEPEKK